MYLEKIKQTNDIKKIEKEHLDELAQEIRDFLIEKISFSEDQTPSSSKNRNNF